jgi:hypothetical protein
MPLSSDSRSGVPCIILMQPHTTNNQLYILIDFILSIFDITFHGSTSERSSLRRGRTKIRGLRLNGTLSFLQNLSFALLRPVFSSSVEPKTERHCYWPRSVQENNGGKQPKSKYKRAAFVAVVAFAFVAVVTKISSDVAGRPGGGFELDPKPKFC